MEKKFKRRVVTGVLLLMLSIISSSSVLAANEVVGKAVPEDIGVAYRGHVQNQGNMPKPEGSLVAGPEALGTRGQSLRVEGFWIELTGNVPEGANIVYEVHVQNEGWMVPVKNGNFAGTAGKSQRVESIKIRLENLPGYDVYYRGHVQNVGDIPQVDGDWGWKKNGEELGTTGSSLRLEELQVKLVKQPDTSTTYDKAGTYGPKTGVDVIENDVVINTPDVILQNLHIKGNLTIGEGVGEGDVTLNNITVDGETYIRGGGKNSIHINGGEYNKITIQQTSSGQVRIVATDAAGLEVVVSEDAKGEDIILEGAFENVQIDAPDVKISTQGETTIKDMVVGESSTGSEITLDKKTTVNKIDLNASVDMKGEGTIEKANVNSDDVTFEKKPVQETVAPEVKVPPVVTPPTPPTPPTPDPTPSSPLAEDLVVKAFNQQKSTDMMVNLLEVHAAAFDLTGFNNLDYLGRFIVGDYLLKKDGFANRAVLQAAITEGIKLAKDDPEARRYIETVTAYSPTIRFQDDNSLLLDYSNPVLAEAQKSLLNGLYADFLVCLETPLADGEAFELTLSGTTKRITNKEMPGREILLSKLMGRTLGSADLVENQTARLTFAVKDISSKVDQYLTLYPCTTRNGDEYCRNFSNAHSIRVMRYWIEAFAEGFSLYYNDSKFWLNYEKTYPAAAKQQLDTCYADLVLRLYRPLESGESITVTVNSRDYTIDANTVMDDDNKTGIRLSKLMGIAATKASELSGEQVIGIKSYQFNYPNGIDAEGLLCKQDGEIIYTLSGAGTSLYPDWLKAYMASVSLSSEENKMTVNYAGNLSPAVCDHLGDYQADVMIAFNRGLEEGETLTITAFEKTKSFTPGDIAALSEYGSQLRLSKLMGVDASLAKSEVGKDEITFTLSGLHRNIYIYSQAVLVKEDAYIYLENLSNSLSLFEASFQAYADSIALQSQQNTFTVTYTGNLAADVKSKLTGYYADALIFTDRPLKDGEEIIVSAFGEDILVTRETFNNVWGTSIRLSDLLELELGDEQLAVNQKGSFEIKVKEKSLSQQLNISASAILVKGNDIEYIDKSTGMSLTPKEFEAYKNNLTLTAEDNKFAVAYGNQLSQTEKDVLNGFYSDAIISLSRPLEAGESAKVFAFGKEITVNENTITKSNGTQIRLSELLGITLDNEHRAGNQTGGFVVEITEQTLKSDLRVCADAILIRDDVDYYINKLDSIYLVSQSFELAAAAYINGLTVEANEQSFKVTYASNLSEADKTGLNGFYADAAISLSRPLAPDEEVTVQAFGKEFPVNRSAFVDESGQFIYLSDLLDLTLGTDQLAESQKGSFEITVLDKSIKSEISVYATPLLRKGPNTRFIYEKQTNITLGSVNNPVNSNDKVITGTTIGTLDAGNITAVPVGTKVKALKDGLTLSPDATCEIVASSDPGALAVTDQENTNVTGTMVIKVTAQDNSIAMYTITMAPVVKSTTPTVGTTTVAKTAQTQASVGFTLTSSHSVGTWKVFSNADCTTAATGVSATLSGSTLTLVHGTDLPAATYYVVYNDGINTDSEALALTVSAYAEEPTAVSAVTAPTLVALNGDLQINFDEPSDLTGISMIRMLVSCDGGQTWATAATALVADDPSFSSDMLSLSLTRISYRLEGMTTINKIKVISVAKAGYLDSSFEMPCSLTINKAAEVPPIIATYNNGTVQVTMSAAKQEGETFFCQLKRANGTLITEYMMGEPDWINPTTAEFRSTYTPYPEDGRIQIVKGSGATVTNTTTGSVSVTPIQEGGVTFTDISH